MTTVRGLLKSCREEGRRAILGEVTAILVINSWDGLFINSVSLMEIKDFHDVTRSSLTHYTLPDQCRYRKQELQYQAHSTGHLKTSDEPANLWTGKRRVTTHPKHFLNQTNSSHSAAPYFSRRASSTIALNSNENLDQITIKLPQVAMNVVFIAR